jgi:hypothetical protein
LGLQRLRRCGIRCIGAPDLISTNRMFILKSRLHVTQTIMCVSKFGLISSHYSEKQYQASGNIYRCNVTAKIYWLRCVIYTFYFHTFLHCNATPIVIICRRNCKGKHFTSYYTYIHLLWISRHSLRAYTNTNTVDKTKGLRWAGHGAGIGKHEVHIELWRGKDLEGRGGCH